MPADLQKVIDDHSGRNIAEWAGQNWIDIETPGRAVMESESKNQFPSMPAAEVVKMREAAVGVYARWVEEVGKLGVDGQALLDDALALVDKYGQ